MKRVAFAAAITFAAAAVAASKVAAAPTPAYDSAATRAAICERGYARRHRDVPYRVRDAVYNLDGLPHGHRRGFGSIISCRWNSEERTRSQTFAYRLAPTLTAKTSTKTDLHDEVCAGSIPLDAARAEMLRLWSAREPVGKR